MNWDDVELKLLAGMPIEIEDCGQLHIPTVKEVIRLGESKYNEYLNLLLLDKLNLSEEVDDQITNFDIVFSNCYHSDEFREKFFKAIDLIFHKKAQMCDLNESSDAFFYFEDGIIERDNFDLIQEIVRTGNHIAKPKREEDEFNFANEQAKSFVEKVRDFRNSFKTKKKEEINLHSMINGMAWKAKNINILNIFELSVYQFRMGFFALNNIDDYKYTLHGIYAGTVDMKKVKFDRLQWAKIIQN